MVKVPEQARARQTFYNEAMGDAPPLAPDDGLDNTVHPLFKQKSILWTHSKY
jgi:hypothetical protein